MSRSTHPARMSGQAAAAALNSAAAGPRLLVANPGVAVALPVLIALALAGLGLLPSFAAHGALVASCAAAALGLVAWAALLGGTSSRRGRSLSFEIVLRPQHYLQACAHLSIYAYWGWYWPVVYESAPLILAQLLFAYAFDMLLSWTRRGRFTLGFGQFPIIFSTNLFLWFKPDWFYYQFIMVAVGFLAKEFIRWNKDGQSAHVFNPSSFPLALTSLILLATGSTDITWGQEIAHTFELPPHMRLWIFLIALPGQFLFGVVTMTMSAVGTVVLFGLAYQAVFGTTYFVDAFIPAAVFLGMHLLFTDPSTSPRSELGRIIYGVMYGLAVVALFGLLGHLGMPTFYDKLLAVPLMNLCIQWIDRLVRSGRLRAIDPSRLGTALAPRQRHLAYMAVWALIFLFMLDPADAYRPRRWVPIWQQACERDLRNGCKTLALIETSYCRQGSSWACNELGLLQVGRRASSPVTASEAFARACSAGLQASCANRDLLAAGAGADRLSEFGRVPPNLGDWPILVQEGQGLPKGLTPAELFERACHQDWAEGCQGLAGVRFGGRQGPRDVPGALEALERACRLKSWSACADLGVLLQTGDGGVPVDAARGTALLQRACDGGFQRACARLQGSAATKPSSP